MTGSVSNLSQGWTGSVATADKESPSGEATILAEAPIAELRLCIPAHIVAFRRSSGKGSILAIDRAQMSHMYRQMYCVFMIRPEIASKWEQPTVLHSCVVLY